MNGASAGTLDNKGNRYWTVDVSRMLPIYRDIYQRVFDARLNNAGVGAEGFVRRLGDVLVYGGPDELVRRLRPAAIARNRLARGDQGWVTGVDHEWRAAADDLEAATTELRRRLTMAEPVAEAFIRAFDAKVALNALGVDSMLPDPSVARGLLKNHLTDPHLNEIVDGCYLPASGAVAFDNYELESLVLARDTMPDEAMPDGPRRRFVQNGLFYRHEALDTSRRDRVLVEMPIEAADAVRRWAKGGPALTAAIEQVSDRAWRRRYHRQWAYQQLKGAPSELLTLFDFAGLARDYDEKKRHLNMGLWRTLFMLGDGLRLDLRGPGATAEGIRRALERHENGIPLDPIFSAD